MVLHPGVRRRHHAALVGECIGSALTMINSIGFLPTIVSIQLASWLLPLMKIEYLFWLLLPGPMPGLWTLRPLWRGR